MNDEVVLIQQVIAQARRLGLLWTLRYATVVNGDNPSAVLVTFDGDVNPGSEFVSASGADGVVSLVGTLTVGTRVATIFVPPAGQYIIGRLQATAGAIIDAGSVAVTPVANTPTAQAVVFTQPFTAIPIVVATAVTGSPGSTVLEVSVTNVTTTGCDVVLYRTNTTVTGVNWQAVQMLT